MSKIIYALLATVTVLVLLFTYRTSTDAVAPAALEPLAVSPAGQGNSSGGQTDADGEGDGEGDDEADDERDSDDESSSGGTTSSGSSHGSGSTTGSGGTTSATSSGLSDGTYQGTTASTRWGPVQVQITVSGGQIIDSQVLQYPTGNSTDERINGYAIPILNSEVLDAQSAQIDMVSGATVTSSGYVDSLQSALDQAHG